MKELKLIKRTYNLIFALVIINPLLSPIINNTTILRVLELLALIGAIYTVLQMKNRNMTICLKSYERFLYFTFAAIAISVVWRGDWNLGPKDFFLKVLSAKLWIIPFLLYVLPNRRNFDAILNVFFNAALFIFPIWLLNIGNLVQPGTYKGEGIGVFLPFLCAFLLGLQDKFTKKQRFIIICIWLVYFILMMLNARRNVSFTLALYAFIAYCFSLKYNYSRNPRKFILTLLLSVTTFTLLFSQFSNLSSGLFKNMSNRADEDTRSGVEELFFIDFMNSPESDWIFGRGIDGSYMQIVKDKETGDISDRRSGIETGYLDMMLKGGLIYDLIIILFMFYALKGAFSKQNSLHIKYIAIILLTYFIDLYTTNPVNTFSPRSILFWFIISVLIQNKNMSISAKYKNT